MKAVNLMPRDARVAGRTAQASSMGVYLLLAALAALVVCVTVWATANKQTGDRRAQLERVTAQAAAAEKRAGASVAFVEFQRLARERVQTVTNLSTTRFDWAHAMREVGRVIPGDVWLSGLAGTTGAAGGPPSTSTSAAPAPVIELAGCTHSQAKVARLMARLRTIDGVRGVTLKTSEKPDGSGDEGCPANRASDPRFTIAVSFAVPGAGPGKVDSTGQVSAAAPASANGQPLLRANQTQAALATVNKDG